MRTTASKASIQKQIIADAFGKVPRKRVTDALRAVLSITPVVRRRLSPLALRRVSSFEVYCEETGVLPKRIGRKGVYLPILEKETLRRAEPLCLDEDRTMFWDHLRSLGQGITKQVPPVFLAGLCNASILNDGATIRSCDNILLCDPAHHPSCVDLGLRPPLVLPPVDLKLSGEYIHFGALWGLEHYHWVLDVLPRLLFVERFDRLRGMPLIVQRGITQTQRESLQILGIRPDRIIEFNGNHWQVEQLYYIQPGMCANPTPLHAQWLRERFVPHSITRSRRLYVSRQDATIRRIVNEADLVKELVPYGFEVVTLGGMSFADQVCLFNEAEIIVGPHGAGFKNAVFAQPGTTLIELFSPSYINGCYWALANACGHRYGFTVGNQCGEDIEANIGKFLRLLISMGADAISVSDDPLFCPDTRRRTLRK
jgi:Glycosyltransferase 61